MSEGCHPGDSWLVEHSERQGPPSLEHVHHQHLPPPSVNPHPPPLHLIPTLYTPHPPFPLPQSLSMALCSPRRVCCIWVCPAVATRPAQLQQPPAGSGSGFYSLHAPPTPSLRRPAGPSNPNKPKLSPPQSISPFSSLSSLSHCLSAGAVVAVVVAVMMFTVSLRHPFQCKGLR